VITIVSLNSSHGLSGASGFSPLLIYFVSADLVVSAGGGVTFEVSIRIFQGRNQTLQQGS